MNIVICTTVGVFILATGGMAMYGLIWGADKLLGHFSIPKIIQNSGVVLILSFVAAWLLAVGYQVGCKVIHLSMGHK